MSSVERIGAVDAEIDVAVGQDAAIGLGEAGRLQDRPGITDAFANRCGSKFADERGCFSEAIGS